MSGLLKALRTETANRVQLSKFPFLSPSETSVIRFTTIFVSPRALFSELMKSAYLIAACNFATPIMNRNRGETKHFLVYILCEHETERLRVRLGVADRLALPINPTSKLNLHVICFVFAGARCTFRDIY